MTSWSGVPPFEAYVASLGRLTAHVDPTAATAEAARISSAAQSLGTLQEITEETLAVWVRQNPFSVPVLGLAVGLSQKKLKNVLKDRFGTSGWLTLAREQPRQLIHMLDTDFDLVRLVEVQRRRTYDFGDLLIARAGTRTTAARGITDGRRARAAPVHSCGYRWHRMEEPRS